MPNGRVVVDLLDELTMKSVWMAIIINIPEKSDHIYIYGELHEGQSR